MEISSTLIKLIVLLATFVLANCPKIFGLYDVGSSVSFLDVGMGDSILIKNEKRLSVLIDGGPDKSSLYKLNTRNVVSPKYLDYVIVSHSHADHITGLIYLLNEYKIGCLIYKLSDKPISIIENRFRYIIESKSIPVSYKDSSECNLEDLNNMIDIFYPPNLLLSPDEQNDETLLVKYSTKRYVFLFTGDAEYNLQDYYIKNPTMCNKTSPRISILKVPHQGSVDSLNFNLLDCIKPFNAVFSVGPNPYGHPHSKVIEAYKSRNISILRTDIIGDIEYKW